MDFEIDEIYDYIKEIYENLHKKIEDKNKKIKDLEDIISRLDTKNKPKPTPSQKRVEKLREAVFKEKDPISSKRAMQILGVNSYMQAIRAMKKADEIYDDLIIHQHPTNLKSYSLLAKAMAGEP